MDLEKVGTTTASETAGAVPGNSAWISRVQECLDAIRPQRLRDSAVQLIDAIYLPVDCLREVYEFGGFTVGGSST